MGFYDIINAVISPVLSPIMFLGPFLIILLISLLVSLIVTLVYKWTTDQELMKSLKDDIKRMQQEMKKLKDKPEKMMKLQKEAMEKNMKYMMHSFKSTLITFIPLIIIFGWLSMNFAYEPIAPGEKFSTYVFLENGNANNAANVTITVPGNMTLITDANAEVKKINAEDNPKKLPFNNQYLTSKNYGGFVKSGEEIYYAGWQLSGKEGSYMLQYNVGNLTYYKEILISDKSYKKPLEKIDDGIVKGIMTDQKKLIVMNIFGWKLGWLGGYIIFSIIFSMALRKFLKVY